MRFLVSRASITGRSDGIDPQDRAVAVGKAEEAERDDACAPSNNWMQREHRKRKGKERMEATGYQYRKEMQSWP